VPLRGVLARASLHKAQSAVFTRAARLRSGLRECFTPAWPTLHGSNYRGGTPVVPSPAGVKLFILKITMFLIE